MSEPKGKVLSIFLDEELDSLVRKRAVELKMSIADVIRQALIKYFGENI